MAISIIVMGVIFMVSVFLVNFFVLRKNTAFVKENNSKNIISSNKISIDTSSRDIFLDGKNIYLTYTEFELLKLLMSSPRVVYKRSDILNHIKGGSYIVTERTIDFQVLRLRKKLGPAGKCIQTVRGVGYRFLDDGLE
tara:strand:- start:6995 stop:7408 length:414 start_codon:yes stop_codon:yes gene_type:complete